MTPTNYEYENLRFKPARRIGRKVKHRGRWRDDWWRLEGLALRLALLPKKPTNRFLELHNIKKQVRNILHPSRVRR